VTWLKLGFITLHAAAIMPPPPVTLVGGAGTGYILALTYLEFNLAQLGHDLLRL